MKVIFADDMIRNTEAMKEYIAEAITCDGIINYINDHSIDIESLNISKDSTIVASIESYDQAEGILKATKAIFPDNNVLVKHRDTELAEYEKINYAHWVQEDVTTLLPVEYDALGNIIEHHYTKYSCSKCGYTFTDKPHKYCVCGAKMDDITKDN